MLLDQASPVPGIDDLLRAGILERVSVTTGGCYGPEESLVLTEQGQRVASSRGWSLRDAVFVIPVGRLVYVPSSARVEKKNGVPHAVRFAFRYEPGSNARLLLSLGPASHWATGDGLTLADAWRIFVKTVPLEYDAASGWSLRNEWLHQRTFVC